MSRRVFSAARRSHKDLSSSTKKGPKRAGSFATAMALFVGLGCATGPTSLAAMETRSHRASFDNSVDLVPRRPVLAHVRFCLFYPDQCETRMDRRDLTLGPAEHLRQIRRVNNAVNRAIRPQPDGEFDSWDINVTHGDCEDYALQKRKELIDMGWPTRLLRIAITRTGDGTLHAVLLVKIDGTDYALDNLTSQVLPWYQTPYEYLMAQGTQDTRSWFTVMPRQRGGTS
ncbi:MAG: hypothetical protein EA339_05925 [Rhodobacteraceae bacterium]|nr:MAG: hypothetical protein EA339_05925 [Paracoccaceae bacterium]